MLLEQCRRLNGGGCVRAGFVVALQTGPWAVRRLMERCDAVPAGPKRVRDSLFRY